MRAVMSAAELAAHKVDAYGRDYNVSDDGYSDMEHEESKGWSPRSGWGADGWDLGDWPYVVIYTRGAHDLMQICEGDRTVYRFESQTDRDAAIDYLFIWYGIGRGYEEWKAAGLTYEARAALDAGTLEVPEQFRGPYRRSGFNLSGVPSP